MKRIGIICAGDEELAPFLPHIENITITDKSMLKFYEGQINGMQVAALYSGVCKVNAAIATQILIDKYYPQLTRGYTPQVMVCSVFASLSSVGVRPVRLPRLPCK